MLILLLYMLSNQADSYHCYEKSEPVGVHLVREIEGVVSGSCIYGKLESSTGGWPKGMSPELHLKQEKNDEIIKIAVDEEGKFTIENIEEGRYCFKIHSNGWETLYGFIEIKKKQKRTELNLILQID